MKVQSLAVLSLAIGVGCIPPPKLERVELWAAGAVASSEGDITPGDLAYSPLQATGAPDVGGCESSALAWSSEFDNGTVNPQGWNEWIELTYDDYLFVNSVKVSETYNPGAIVAIDVEASDGSVPPERLYDDLTGEPGPCPSVLATYVDQGTTVEQYNRVVIYLNTDLIGDANGDTLPNDYNEIDAVQLVGDRYVD